MQELQGEIVSLHDTIAGVEGRLSVIAGTVIVRDNLWDDTTEPDIVTPIAQDNAAELALQQTTVNDYSTVTPETHLPIKRLDVDLDSLVDDLPEAKREPAPAKKKAYNARQAKVYGLLDEFFEGNPSATNKQAIAHIKQRTKQATSNAVVAEWRKQRAA
jgi:hypothetical protein